MTLPRLTPFPDLDPAVAHVTRSPYDWELNSVWGYDVVERLPRYRIVAHGLALRDARRIVEAVNARGSTDV